MGDGTGIEWTDATWNPLVGCTKVSSGCDNCYAETFVNRFAGSKGFPERFDTVVLRDQRFLSQPLRWRRPRRVFVNSLSDLFHTDVPDEFIATVFAVMAEARRHTFQLLTKRHGRMRSLLNSDRWPQMVADAGCALPDWGVPLISEARCAPTWPLPNVWLGVSVEDQKHADLRIPALLGTPAAVRWISAEPLLGPVDLTRLPFPAWTGMSTGQPAAVVDAVGGRYGVPGMWQAKATGLDWVVCGGESGPASRPMHPDWACSLRDQCETVGVPFLFKQWGSHDEHGVRMGKHRAGRYLGGVLHDGYPPTLS